MIRHAVGVQRRLCPAHGADGGEQRAATAASATRPAANRMSDRGDEPGQRVEGMQDDADGDGRNIDQRRQRHAARLLFRSRSFDPPSRIALSVSAVQRLATCSTRDRSSGSGRPRRYLQSPCLAKRVQHADTIARAEFGVAGFLAGYLAGIEELHFAGFDRRRHDLREQPDAGDQQRLVDQVESQAVAAGEEQRASPSGRHAGRQACQQARLPGKFCRGDADQHRAEPRKDRHIVVGARVGLPTGRPTTSPDGRRRRSADRGARR